jgi:rubrerythrin
MKKEHMPDWEERKKLLKKAPIGVWRCLDCGHDRPAVMSAVGGLPEPDKQYNVFVERNTIGCPKCGKSIMVEMSVAMCMYDPWKTCPICGSRKSRNMFVEIRKMQIGRKS